MFGQDTERFTGGGHGAAGVGGSECGSGLGGSVGTRASLLDTGSAWHETAEQSRLKWHVLYVKSRQEKILADDLGAMGITHFLPLIRESRYSGKRKSVVEMPLFPGYLFLKGTLDEAYRADRTKRVVRIISVPDQSRIDWELRNIHQALNRSATLDPYPSLRVGVRVAGRSGPFRGIQGIIEDRGSADRLVLQVELLGRGATLEIGGAVLEAIE